MLTLRSVCKDIVDEVFKIPTSETKLTELFEIEDEAWENIYKLPFIVTIENKMRSFQFKVNRNIFFTNEKLKKIGIGKTDLCTFCEEEVETLKHIFILVSM